MIVGFSRYSTGGGNGVVDYFTKAANPNGTPRTPLPEIVRGNAELVRRLIDVVPFERTYTSGVLSFAPEEVITPAMEQTILDGFERVAFAGLTPDRYSMLWVRHVHAGHHELHFVTPRMELASGKSLNIHPPGRVSQALFDTFRSVVNSRYGLADPTDPVRARAVHVPHHVAKHQAEAVRQEKARPEDRREQITAGVRVEVDAGRVTDRAGVERYLERLGYSLSRRGKDYVTVVHPETGERVRLKGGLYSREGFAQAATAPGIRYGVPDPSRAAVLSATLEPMITARATFHHRRYGALESAGDSPHEPELLKDYMTRHLGTEALHTTWWPRRQRQAAGGQSLGLERSREG